MMSGARGGSQLGTSVSVSELDSAAQARLPAALPLSEAEGGTASSTFAAARTAMGLVIGTNVQAQSATLTTLASATAAGLALMDDANAAAQRTTLGLGLTVTLPTVVDSRWTDAGLIDGFVYADHNFPTVASIVASPESATIYNSARWSILSSGSGVMTLRPDGTATDWNYIGPLFTGAYMAWAMGPRGFIEFHLRTSAAASVGGQMYTRIIIRDAGALGTTKRWATIFQGAGGAFSNTCAASLYNASTTTDVTTTAPSNAQLDTGHWLRLEVHGDGTVRALRVAGSAGSRPALKDYVVLGSTITSATEFFKASSDLEAGFLIQRTGSPGTNDSMIVSGLRIGRSLPVVIS